MDPRYTFRKGYDTDLLILRSLFALNSNTNQPISSFYTVVADGIGGIQWLSPDQYFSCATGILNFVSSVESFSTVTGLFSNFSTQSFSSFYTRNLLTSSISTFYISSQSIFAQNLTASSISLLDGASNGVTQTATFSSGALFVNGNLFYNPNTVLTNQLASTVGGLGTAGYISSSQFLSTIDKLGSNGLGYVNRPQLVSTTAGIGIQIGSTTVGLVTTPSALASTVGGLGTAGYVSSATLSNTIRNLGTTGYISTQTLTNTVANLGTTGYISSSQLLSTTDGITRNIYPPLFTSTVAGLAVAGYISSSQLISTVAGLGASGYISSSQLFSTVAGLGGAGLVSSGQLLSTVIGLGTAGYISSSQLQSTVVGLGGTGLVSTGQLVSTTIGLSNLILPASGVSQSQLVSTTSNLTDNFYVVNASQVYVNNSRVSISSVGTFIFFSTFMNSSITYQGNNGQITASNAAGPTAPFYFSSATLNLDRWSSFINAQSIITIEAYPTFLFANNGLPAANPTLIFMSTFIQAGGNFTSSQMFQSALYPDQYGASRSNSFYLPMKLTIPGAAVQGFYPQATRLAHYLPNAYTVGVTQGFSNSNVSIFFGSTNSLFLSIQNLPL
jgi:hypothetical protein